MRVEARGVVSLVERFRRSACKLSPNANRLDWTPSADCKPDWVMSDTDTKDQKHRIACSGCRRIKVSARRYRRLRGPDREGSSLSSAGACPSLILPTASDPGAMPPCDGRERSVRRVR